MSRVLRLAVASVGILLVGGTVAWATGLASFGFVGGDGAITACVQNSNGDVRFIDPSSPTKDLNSCRADESVVTLNQNGRGPAEVTVDCPAQSINQALQDNADATSIDITVNGTCPESVYINRAFVGITAGSGGATIQSPNAGDCAICLGGASNVFLNGLTLSGGGLDPSSSSVFAKDLHITGASTAVGANGGAAVTLNDITVDDCQDGLNASGGASISMFGGSIDGCREFAVSAHDGGSIRLNGGAGVTNSKFQGVIAGYGGSIAIGNATIDGAANTTVFAFGGSISVRGANTLVTNSSFCGVAASDGGNASVESDARVSGNHGGGVCADNGSHVLIQDGGIVENNNGPGVQLLGASSLRMRGNAVVRDNSGNGIRLSDTSVAEFQEPNSQITGNGGWGIFCDGPPSVAMISGDPGTVSGNAAGQNNCQNAGS